MYVPYNNKQPIPIFLTDKKFTRDDVLICSSSGTIYAVHKKEGIIIYKIAIDNPNSIISLFITDDDIIIAGACNKTFSIHLMTGKLIWVNILPGLATGDVSVLTTPSTHLRPQYALEEPADTDSPPEYDQIMKENPIVIACAKGQVIALNLKSGAAIWFYQCNSTALPTAIIEPPNKNAGRPIQLVYVGVGRSVHCLNAKNGTALWSLKLSKHMFSSRHVVIASPWSSKFAVETHTAFNQNPVIQISPS